MPESRARDLATSLGQAVELNNITSAGGLASSGTGLVTYTNVSNLPGNYDSNNAGSLAFVTDSDKLYIHTGQGWFNIAIINTNPIWVTQPDASYALATNATEYLNGTATTITLVARDSEGQEIQWSTETDAGFDNMAYISQTLPGTSYENDSAVFTIEPMTQDSATSSSGSVTFKASDGVNVITASASFTLTFVTAESESAETRLLLKASGDDGTNTTSSGSAVSFTGNASNQAFTPYYPGGYSVFTGPADSSYVQLAASSNYNFDNSGWQLEGWIYVEAEDGGNCPIFEFHQDDNNYFRMFKHGAPGIDISGKEGGTAYVNQGSSNGEDLHLHTWYHWAVNWDGSKLRAYFDGRLIEESGTISTDLTTTLADQSFYLGQDLVSTDRYAQAFYHDVRLQTGSSAVTYTGSTYSIPTTALDTDSDTKFHLASGLPYINDPKGGTVTPTGEVEMRRFIPYDHEAYSVNDHGASVHFDGDDDVRKTGYTNPIGTGDYTVECWVYPTIRSGSGARYVFALQDGHSTSNGHGIQVYYRNSSNQYKWAHFTNNSQNNTDTKSQLNTWQHVAVTRDSGTTRFFVNGALIDTRTSDNYDATAYDDITVGGSGYGNNLVGYISDFRVINGTALYTSAFTPPTAPLASVSGSGYSTSLLTCNDGPNVYDAGGHSSESIADLTDRTQTDQTGVQLFGNAVSSTDQTKYASSNMYIPGSTGDYIETPFPTLKQEDFTWEWWIYPTNVNGSYQAIVDPRQGNTGLPLIWIRNTNVIYYFSGGDKIVGTTTLQSNTWYHIALVRGAKRAALYLDGSLEGVAADTGTFQNGGVLRVGHRYQTVTAGFYPYSGYVEDMRITKGLVRYPFTPPNETVSNTTATKLIACHDSTVTTDGTGTHTITAYGNAASIAFGPHSAMRSTYFDGTGDYLEVDNSTEFQHSTNDNLSIDFWMYYTGGSGTRNIVDNRGNANGYAFQLLSDNTVGIYSEPAAGYVHTSTALDERKWYHIVYSRVSGTSYMFVNGALAGAGVADTNNYTSQSIVIGARHSKDQQYYTGYVSNFRVVQGASLFPNSFTPPTAELTA
tara:strand:- start:831 stop:4034 length:3204 start_codon:yes stop_codon:yes gene_type:complete